MRRLRNSALLRGFSIYFGASVLNRAVPFFLLPVLTAYLSPEMYGTMTLFQAIVALSLPLISMNMGVNITRRFFNSEKSELAGITTAILVILGATSLAVLLGLTPLKAYLASITGVPGVWISLAPLIVAGVAINDLGLIVLRNQGKAAQFGALEIGKTITELGLTVWLVVGLGMGWEGRAIGMLVAAVLFAVLAIERLVRQGYLTLEVPRSAFSEVLRISTPFVPHAVGMAVISMSDRFFLARIEDAASVGIYTAGAQFGMIMAIFVTAFNRSWSPWFFKQLSLQTESARRRVVKATYAFSLVSAITAVAVSVGATWLLPLMTAGDYHFAVHVVPWVAVGYAFQGMYMTVYGYAVQAGKTYSLAATTGIVAVLTLVLNFVLIKSNGIVGAAQATLGAYAFLFLLTWWAANRVYPMPWLLRRP